MLINQDPPDHTKLRQIIRRGFTPRSIGALHDDLERRAHEIVDDGGRQGRGQLRRGRRGRAAAAGDRRPARRTAGGPRASSSTGPTRCWPTTTPRSRATPDVAAAEILGYAMALADERARQPAATTSSPSWSPPTSTAARLTDDEFGFFMILLAVAGNETTRNAITHGMNAFFEHPDQWELYKRDAPGDRGRRDHPLGHPGHGLPAHRAQRRRGRRPAGQEGRAGRALLRQRATSTRTSSTDPFTLRHPPRPEPAPVLRRPRRALLHRRQPGPPRGRPDLQRDRRACPGHPQLGEPRRLRHGWINGIKDLQVAYR